MTVKEEVLSLKELYKQTTELIEKERRYSMPWLRLLG